MRPIPILAAIACCSLALCAEIPLSEGFESDEATLVAGGWRLGEGCSIEGNGARVGEGCLKVESVGVGRRYAEVFLPVESGRFYAAECFVRCEGIRATPESGRSRGAVIFLQFADAKKGWVGGGSFPEGLQGTQDWTLRKVPYTRRIPAGVAHIQLLLGVEGEGVAWFDEVKVHEIETWDGVTAVEPAGEAEVAVRLPVLSWSTEDRLSGGTVELSQSPQFPAGETQVIECAENRCRPPEPLAVGRWYWRVSAAAGGGVLPPGPTASFTVAADAPVWPVSIEPAWQWSDDPRPVLEALVTPAEAEVEVTAAINGEPAETVDSRDGRFRFRPTLDLPAGIHEVTITARGPGGRAATETGIFCSKQPGSRVAIRDDKILLVDGEPFFPLGAYRDPSDSLDDFSGLLEAGFNLTHNYAFENHRDEDVPPETARDYLRAAHAAGLKVFMGFNRTRIDQRAYTSLQRRAAELMDEPGLLAWYMIDEPAARGIPVPALERLNRALHAVDPFHPTSIVYCVPSAFEAYAPCSDIVWNDPYPVPSRPVTMVEEWAQGAMAATLPGQPYWAVLQGHDIRYWKDYEGAVDRFGPVSRPTPQETRCMAYLALCNGAKGLVWYWGPNSTYHIQSDAPEVWRGICDTVQELRALSPWLVAGETEKDALQVPEPLRAWTRESDGKRVVALVNVSEEPVEADVDLSAFGVREVTERSSGEKAAVQDGRLQVRLEGLGVKVVEWEG